MVYFHYLCENTHSFVGLKELNWNVLLAILRLSVEERKKLFIMEL